MAVMSNKRARIGRARRKPARPLFWAAVVVLILIVALGLFGPFFLADPEAQRLADAELPPAWLSGGSSAHLLGTDSLGRDELAMAASGIRTSLLISVLATAIGAVVGVALGMVAGYFRGVADQIIMRLVDIQMSIPGVLLVLAFVTVLRPSFPSVITVLALSAWVLFARVARAEVLSLREQDVVLAIRSLGASTIRVLLRHVLPNIIGPLMIIATLEIASLIIAEASLGYLGLGVPPPTQTLGRMISAGQSGMTAGIWWPVVVPGVVIALFIICINVIGDGLRDILDPKGRARR